MLEFNLEKNEVKTLVLRVEQSQAREAKKPGLNWFFFRHLNEELMTLVVPDVPHRNAIIH